jgi:hypothetical protein
MKYSVDDCIHQCQKQAEIILEPDFKHFMEDTATYLISYQESDEVFRKVVDKLTADNGGIIPRWLLDMAALQVCSSAGHRCSENI